MQPCYHGLMEPQAMTVRLPRALYERLRREAFETHTSQAAIITEALTDRYERIDGTEADRNDRP